MKKTSTRGRSSQTSWIDSLRVVAKEKTKKKTKTKLQKCPSIKNRKVIASVFTNFHPSISAAESSVSVNNELRIAAQGASESSPLNQLPNNEIVSWSFLTQRVKSFFKSQPTQPTLARTQLQLLLALWQLRLLWSASSCLVYPSNPTGWLYVLRSFTSKHNKTSSEVWELEPFIRTLAVNSNWTSEQRGAVVRLLLSKGWVATWRTQRGPASMLSTWRYQVKEESNGSWVGDRPVISLLNNKPSPDPHQTPAALGLWLYTITRPPLAPPP